MTDATLLAAVEIAPGDTLDAIVLGSSAALLGVGAPSALSPTARAGRVSAESTVYSLDNAAQAYQDLRDGRISGRAVVVP